VPLNAANGLEQRSAVSCDHLTTIPTGALGRQIGLLLDHQERELTDAIHAAFDLD
jgi:mRNA interferase MazF